MTSAFLTIPALVLLAVSSLSAQDSCSTAPWRYDPDNAVGIDWNYPLPALFRDEAAVKRYIRDPRFLRLRLLCTDTVAIDAIFERAREIAQGNTGHALLIATLATFDHFSLRFKIPLIGAIPFPLTAESRSTFAIRHKNLPRRVLPDSLGALIADKDKLQHFFGSAFLAYEGESAGFANFIGNFIEWGEPGLVVGGENDPRDKLANHLGQQFGLRLLDGEDVYPSDILASSPQHTP